MKRLLVTTVVRHSNLNEPSGFIYEIDLDGVTVLNRCPIPEPRFLRFDANKRGGFRGGKGMAMWGDLLCIANSEAIYRFDHQWNGSPPISHPSCAGIHDIIIHDDLLWVTSARNDLVVGLTRESAIKRIFNYREHPEVLQELGIERPVMQTDEEIRSGTIDFRNLREKGTYAYDGAHVNSLCVLPNGDMMISLGMLRKKGYVALFDIKQFLQNIHLWPVIIAVNNAIKFCFRLKSSKHTQLAFVPTTSKSALIRCRASGKAEVFRVSDRVTTPNHSLVLHPDGSLIYADTNSGLLLRIHADTGETLEEIEIPGKFLRGLALIDDHRITAGVNNRIHMVDLNTSRIVDQVDYSEDPRECVYDIAVLPEHFAPLPAQLHVAPA